MDKSKAITIVEALANGTDPMTDEVFPPESPYQHVEVVRALFMATEALKKIKDKNAPPVKGLENRGKPWDESEDEKLKDAFLEGRTIEELAIIHQRTAGAIRSRLEKNRFIDRFGNRIVHASKKQ
jgi:hypothetical protein